MEEAMPIQVTASGEGEALWFLDTLMHVKLGSADTRGSLSVFEQLAPSGSATPMHRHDHTEEYFYILDGEVTFHTGTDVRVCGAGAFISVPRGTAHAFRVSSPDAARLLVISNPSSFEDFVRAVSRPADHAGLPPEMAAPSPEMVQELASIGAEHDTILLGPPPSA
jgi:quercetin dioxygenase-like cupin family protein